MNIGNVDYSSAVPPDGYRCTVCGAHGVKLWREYQTFADHIALQCCDCTGKEQEKDVSEIDDEGRIPRDPKVYGSALRCDQIGWCVPAIPTQDGSTYWGYTSVPENGIAWWRRLSNRLAASL